MRHLCLGLLIFFNAAGAQGDWRQFRGNTTSAVTEESILADDQKLAIAWSRELPGRGLSSPIVVGERVIVTASSGPRQDRLHVLTFEATDGRPLWERQFWATGRTVSHPRNCVAAPTPASDGRRIFAFYSSNDVICLDLDGNLLWCRGLTYDYPNASNSLGMASSLLVVEDTLIAMVESDSESFTVGLDVFTGEDRWRIERPRAANWTSPALWSDGTSTLVLLQSSKGVAAVEPRTGRIVWNYGDGAATIPSLTVSEGIAYVPSHGVTAIRPGSSTPDVAEIVWQQRTLVPGFASPVACDGSLFVLTDPNVLVMASTADGTTQWKRRLSGNFSGSPIIAANHLIAVNEDGVVHVVEISDGGRIQGTLELGETVLCTPAAAGGALYVRSDGHLWKLAGE